MFLKISGALTIAFAVSSASAEGLKPGTWELNLGGVSQHFNGTSKKNPLNYGLGVHYQWTEDVAVLTGMYHNSLARTSKYLFGEYQPFEIWNTRIGVTAGVASGYSDNGGLSKVIVPSWSKQFKGYTLYGLVAPPYKGREGIIAVGLKLPFDELSWFK